MKGLLQCRHIPQETGLWEEVIYLFCATAVSTGFTLHRITEYPELEGTHPFWRFFHFFHPDLLFCQGRGGRETLIVVSPSNLCLELLHASLTAGDSFG